MSIMPSTGIESATLQSLTWRINLLSYAAVRRVLRKWKELQGKAKKTKADMEYEMRFAFHGYILCYLLTLCCLHLPQVGLFFALPQCLNIFN